MDSGLVKTIAQSGDLEVVRPWASVSKMAVALAFGVEVSWQMHRYEEFVRGHPGITFANLLSHSAGFGLEENDPRISPASKRIYSNFGIDLAVQSIVENNSPAAWLNDRVFLPFGMTSTHLVGRPAAGVEGSTADLARLAVGWLRPDGISAQVRNRIITPYVPELAGVVPGFGRFAPCPWGLGPEVRGEKHHWMGEWPSDSFGHFGQSGALMLLNATEQIAVVATSSHSFGPWAQELWPEWTTSMRALALKGAS
jgi:CubicO group peptidase (beta-lactamase class C family)